jgi:hypothetical protein
MLAAADDAPLAASGVDVDQIIRRERRGIVVRRAGLAAGALVVAFVAAFVVPRTGTVATTAAPISRPSRSAPAASAPLRITTDDLVDAAPHASEMSRNGMWVSWVGDGKRGALYMYVQVRQGAGGDPCVLAPGATPGVNGAPTPADTCTQVFKNGRSAWVRRWGYAPDVRPWSNPDTIVIEVFYSSRGRSYVLAMTNTLVPTWMGVSAPAGPQGPPFEISDDDIAAFVL